MENPTPIRYFLSAGLGGYSPVGRKRGDKFGLGGYYVGASTILGQFLQALLVREMETASSLIIAFK